MKYELTDETIEVYGRTLHRIKALKDIGTSVKKGDLGGFVESERNLSQEGNCWVYDSAKVFGSSMVYGSAKVCDEAGVYGSATVCGSAKVCGSAEITKTTDVFSVTPIGSRNGTTTFYKAKDGKIFVKCGCKNTDIDTWLGMVQATHGENKHAKAYRLAAQIAKLQISGEEE